jgi:hypothetical protein
MSNWLYHLENNPVDWLLEKKNPSVRYFTLLDLLGRKRTDSDVEEAKDNILRSEAVSRILSKQKAEGYWEEPQKPYSPKYKSTYWQIMILAQLGTDINNEETLRACEFVWGLQLNDGGFSSSTKKGALEEYEWMRTRTVLKENLQPEPDFWARSMVMEHQYSCLTGNLCAAMLRIGYCKDSRLTKALNWLAMIQNNDGGWLCPYWKAHINDTHSCFHGTICSLDAFSEAPERERSQESKRAIMKGADFLLMHRLYKADHHGYKVINPRWLRFSFPWFYGYDILRGLSVLTKLGYVNDERLSDAVEMLVQKRQPDGKWLLESAPTGRMHVTIEKLGAPSKWITLNALRVLNRLQQTKNGKLKSALAKL